MDGLCVFRTRDLPGIAILQPMIRFFDLLSVNNLLTEDAIVIAKPIAHAGQFEGGERVHEACGQTPEAAIAKTSVNFEIAERIPVQAILFQRLAADGVHLQVDDVVAQETANQKFEREIIDALHIVVAVFPLCFDPPFNDAVADTQREGRILVSLGCVVLCFRERVANMTFEILL